MPTHAERTGAGSSWDTGDAAGAVERAYLAPDMVAIRAAQVDLLDPRPGERIVDVGCGPAIFAADVAARGAQVVALDSAPAMLDAARLRAAAVPGVEVGQADALSLPLPDASCDAAVLVQVLEYLADPVAALREAARVLRPGGRILAADTDWDTLAFAIDDVGLARAVAHAYADARPFGQGGRLIPGWLREAGLDVVAARPQVLQSTTVGGDTFIRHTWPGLLDELRGVLPAAAVARFAGQVAAAEARGGLVFSVIRHAWLARLPSAAAPVR